MLYWSVQLCAGMWMCGCGWVRMSAVAGAGAGGCAGVWMGWSDTTKHNHDKTHPKCVWIGVHVVMDR